MKVQFAILAGVALLTVMLSASALAQADIQNRVRADIPEDFQAGVTMLPAGDYTFVVDTNAGLVQVIQESTGHSLLLSGSPASPNRFGHYYLMFDKAGDTYYHLAGIQAPDFAIRFRPQATKYGLYATVRGEPEQGGLPTTGR